MVFRAARLLAATLGLAGLLSLSAAGAAERKPYDAAGFAAAQAAGKPIVVDVTASWCPTCQAQKPIIEGLCAKPDYANLIVLEVNFDDQQDAVKAFGARMQSTLVAFKGKTEVARSVGDTKAASIEELFKAASGG